MTEKYVHKEPTVLIELEQCYVNNLLDFFKDLELRKYTELCYESDILATRKEYLIEKYNSYWDLYDRQQDMNPLIEALKEAK